MLPWLTLGLSAIIFASRRSLWPGLVIVLLMAGPTVGLHLQMDRWGAVPGMSIAFWVLPAFAFGALLVSVRRPSKQEPVPLRRHTTAPGDTILVVIALALVTHFSVVGIPLLSPNVETSRFQVYSGFGGIPSRLTLYAVPLLVIPVLLYPTMFSRRGRKFFWFMAITSRLLLGFKSGLIGLLLMALIALLIRRGMLRPRTIVRLGALSVAAAGFAFFVGGLYGTLGKDGLGINYWTYRITESASEAGWQAYILHHTSHTAFFQHDLSALLNKYFGSNCLNSTYSVEQLVFSRMIGVPISSGTVSGSVTVGGLAYLPLAFANSANPLTYAFFGVVSAAALGGLWQLACGYLSEPLRDGGGIFLASGVLLAVRDAMTNGGVPYIALNYGFAACLVTLIAWCTKLFLARIRDEVS